LFSFGKKKESGKRKACSRVGGRNWRGKGGFQRRLEISGKNQFRQGEGETWRMSFTRKGKEGSSFTSGTGKGKGRIERKKKRVFTMGERRKKRLILIEGRKDFFALGGEKKKNCKKKGRENLSNLL